MKSEKEAVSKGKKPFFLKKRVLREAELKDRFDSLEKKGRVNKYMEKKRKRNAQRQYACCAWRRIVFYFNCLLQHTQYSSFFSSVM